MSNPDAVLYDLWFDPNSVPREVAFVEITEAVIGVAAQIAEVEALRGYDVIHLTAALAIEAAVLTSADAALCDAAARSGLHVANPVEA